MYVLLFFILQTFLLTTTEQKEVINSTLNTTKEQQEKKESSSTIPVSRTKQFPRTPPATSSPSTSFFSNDYAGSFPSLYPSNDQKLFHQLPFHEN